MAYCREVGVRSRYSSARSVLADAVIVLCSLVLTQSISSKYEVGEVDRGVGGGDFITYIGDDSVVAVRTSHMWRVKYRFLTFQLALL